MWSGGGHLTSALLATLFLAILAIVVRLGLTAGADLAGLEAAQSIASYPLDVVANAHTAIGQVIPTVLFACVLAVIAGRRYGPLAALAPLLILATGGIELALKLTTAHPPPGEEYVRAFMNPLGVRVPTPSAFPSGHVTRIVFLALMIGAMLPAPSLSAVGRWWPWLAGSFIVLSLFLRVYIGDHWPSDVLGGLALGTLFGVLAAAWLRSARSASRDR